MSKLCQINSERDAANNIIEWVENELKANPNLTTQGILKTMESDEQKFAKDINELQDKIRLFDYQPTDHEINLQTGRYFALRGYVIVRKILADIYIHVRNKQFVNDYQSTRKL